MPLRWWFLLLAVVPLLPSSSLLAATKAEIAAAYARREAALPTVKIEWTAERTEAKGWIRNPKQSEQFNPHGRTDPPEDIQYTVNASLTLDGDRIRYEYRQSRWDFAADFQGFKSGMSVFDGKLGKAYRPPGDVLGFPNGSIYPATKPAEWEAVSDAFLVPVLWALRPTWVSPLEQDHYRVADRAGVIDGRSCVLIEKVGETSVSPEYWLDEAAGFALLRWTSFDDEGNLEGQYDLSYNGRDPGSPIPTGWKSVVFRAGKPIIRTQGVVTSFSESPTIQPGAFNVEFPVGTRVIDQTREDGRVPYRSYEYIVREGGAERPVGIEEWKRNSDRDPTTWTAAYEQIRDSDPPGSRLLRFFYWTLAAAAVLGLVWFAIARRRSRASQ